MVSCTEWVYSFSQDYLVDNAVFSQYDLVCEKSKYNSMSQSVYFFGAVLGVTVSGVLSDNFGRKRVTISLMLLNTATGLACAWMPYFEAFVAARFLMAFLSLGVATCSFTWLLEFIGSSRYQTICGIAIEYFWTVGWLMLALFAYFIRDWRWLIVAISVPGLVVVPLIWIIPESPRWLQSVGNVAEAEAICRRIAAENGLELAESWSLPKPERNNNRNEKTVTFLDLFKTPILRVKTLIVFFNWFAISFAYYGLTLNSASLGGNLLLKFSINGVMEVPAYTLAMLVILYMGRRIPHAFSMIGAGICLLSVILVPEKVSFFDT